MYELLVFIFSTILLLTIYAAIRYGFNIVFLYIGLFSIVLIIWGGIAIFEERKK